MKLIYTLSAILIFSVSSYSQTAPDSCHCNNLIKMNYQYQDSIKNSTFKSKYSTFEKYIAFRFGSCDTADFSPDFITVFNDCDIAYRSVDTKDSLCFIWGNKEYQMLKGFISVDGLEIPNCFSCKMNSGVQNIAEKNLIYIYPVPAEKTIFIEANEHYQLNIYSVDGKEILSNVKIVKGKNQLNISDFNTGLYFYRGFSSNGKIIEGKFVKN